MLFSAGLAKYVDRSVISFPVTITPFSDQLLAEDDETVNKKSRAYAFSLPLPQLRSPIVLDDLSKPPALVAARRMV
jgi:hypothetical protein